MLPMRILNWIGTLLMIGGLFLCFLGFGNLLHSNHATCCHVTPTITERLDKYFKTATIDSVGTTEFLNTQGYQLGTPVPDSQLSQDDRAMLQWKLSAWLAIGAAESWQDEVMSSGRTGMIAGSVAAVLGLGTLVASR